MRLYCTGQCDSLVEACVDTVVSCNDDASGCDQQKFTAEGNVTTFKQCEVIIQIEGTFSKKCQLDISSICLSAPAPSCATPTDLLTTTPTTMPPTVQPKSPTTSKTAFDIYVVGSLGAMVGLLVVLVVLMAIGWVWTCYIMNRRGKIIEQLNAR